MKKRSDLKICVLGGRNFGKTSLLSSLILISGDKSSGITVSGGNEQKLSIYNEYKNNNGKLIATNWDDICKFRYNLAGNENKRYKLTFIDYPGEFFQKFFSDSGVFSARFLSMFGLQKKNQESIDSSRTFTKNEVKFAKRLVNELKNADAFIVLLPADVTKDIYKVNLQIFKTQLQILLEKIHNINPYIPVCLAINKWDMFGKAYTELSDILQSKPYKDFDNMLNLECGEYYFCQAISAFGKNRSAEAKTEIEQEEFKEEWDRKSEPVNVMQMLLKISEVAEKSRYLHLREKYNNASWFSKIFHFPAMLASLCRKGANAEEDRNFCTKQLTRCTLGLIGTVASVALLCFVAIGALTTLGEFTYLKIQESSIAEVEKSLEASKTDNTTAEKIKGLKETLAGHPLNLAFFCKPQVVDLSARITKIEQQYNLRVWQNAVVFCDNNRNKDEDPLKLQSEERKARCETRIQHLEREQAKLTDLPTRNSDGRTLKDCFQQKINQERTLLANIGKDGGLDDALYALNAKKNEDKCGYIESLIDRYESTYSYRKRDFDELRRQLKNQEQQYHDQLIADLNEIKDIVSKDYVHRIALARKRIARIGQEKTHLSIRSLWHERNKQLIDAENLNIENWTHDSKFYVALGAAMKPGDDQIQRLVNFLKDYDKIAYSRCAADWNKADKTKNELIAAVNKNLQETIKNNPVDAASIDADERQRRINIIIEAYEKAKTTNPTQVSEYDAIITNFNLQLQQVETDKLFETDHKSAMSPGENQIQRLVDFLKKYPKSPSDRYANDWNKADKKKNELIVAVNKNLQKTLNANSVDEPQITAVEKAKRLQNRIRAYEQAKTENPTEAEKYNASIATLKRNLADAEKDKKFEAAYNKLLASADKGKLIQINSFITTGEFAEVNFAHKSAEYKKLEEEKARLLKKWNKEQDEARKKYLDDPKQSRAIRLDRAEKLLVEYNRLLAEYLPTSAEYHALNRCIRDLNGQIAEHKKYNTLLNEFNKIKTHTDSFRIVKAIANFDSEYKASDYPVQDGVAVFTDLNNLRKQHNEVVTKKFDEAEKNFKRPADDEFAELARYYQELKQNTDKFMEKLSLNVAFYKELQDIKRRYNDNITKYQRFAKIAAELSPLISDGGQKSVKDARSRLNAIKAFYTNEDFCKELASAPELVDLATSLKKVQAGVENFIDRELSAQLEEISKKLPIGASPQDQIANWRQQLNLIDEFCSIMIQSKDNALYRNFSTRRRELQTRLGKKELKTRFDSDRSKLDEQLNGGLDVTNKIALIDDFIGKYSQHENFKEQIDSYTSQKNNYDQIRRFESLEQRCKALIDRKPSNEDEFKNLAEYRDSIQKKLECIKEFESFSGVQQRVEGLKTSLLGEIDYVKKAVGDGSWTDISQKEDAYKTNPSESTYVSLKRAIDAFDSKEYSSYKKKVNEIKNNSQKDYTYSSNLEKAVSEYKRNPNHNSFCNMCSAVQELNDWVYGKGNSSGYESNHIKKLSTYNKYISKIRSGLGIRVTCRGATFEGTWDSVHYEVSCNGKIEMVGKYFHAGDITGGKSSVITLEFERSLVCEFRFEDMFSYDTEKVSIDFWKIIQDGNSPQTFVGNVHEYGWGIHKARLTFDISGVPEL